MNQTKNQVDILINEKRRIPVLSALNAIAKFLIIEHKETGKRPLITDLNVETGECLMWVHGELESAVLDLKQYHIVFAPKPRLPNGAILDNSDNIKDLGHFNCAGKYVPGSAMDENNIND